MFDASLIRFSSKKINKVAIVLTKRGFSANQISIIGFLFGVLAFVFISLDKTIIGLFFLIFNRFADGLDGAIARVKGLTREGAFIDIVFDFIVYAMIPLAFCVRSPEDSFAATILLTTFFGTAVTFLAFAVMAARVGIENKKFPNKSFYYMQGPVEGLETFIFFALMCLWPLYFSIFAYVFASMCLVSTFWRFFAGLYYLNGKRVDQSASL